MAFELIKAEKFDAIYIISDEPAHAKQMSFLNGLDPIFISEDSAIQFILMMHADVLIIPNSSFSWWGAFLNNRPGRRVIAPLNWVGHHVGIEYPAGIMIDDFIWI
jgi:hypothetical protein